MKRGLTESNLFVPLVSVASLGIGINRLQTVFLGQSSGFGSEAVDSSLKLRQIGFYLPVGNDSEAKYK